MTLSIIAVMGLLQASLCFLVMSWLPAILGCNLEGMQVCVFNEELKRQPLSVMFYPEFSDYKLACQRQQAFLDCAWQEEYVSGCSQVDLASLIAFQNVHKAVCLVNAYNYNRSRSCILELQDEVRKCLRGFARAMEDHCYELETTRACVRGSTKKELCDDVDKMFLGKIIDLNLSPFAHVEHYNCEMSTFGEGEMSTFAGEEEKETTQEATSTTEAETTTSRSEVTTVANTEKVKLMMVMNDNSSSKHSTDVLRVTALFFIFLSFYVGRIC